MLSGVMVWPELKGVSINKLIFPCVFSFISQLLSYKLII